MTTEPLVLVPPILCDARVFGPQIGALSADGPVIVAPSHLADTVDEMVDGMLEWLPGKFALCGMGLGGAVALQLQKVARDRITRLALISCTAQAETPQMASAREPLIVAARSGRFSDAIAQEIAPDHLAPGASRRQVCDLVEDMAQGIGIDGYVNQARAMQRRKDQQITLRKVRQPAVVICGQEDSLVPVRRQQFMSELIPYGKLEVIADAGHLPTLEEPVATTIVLRDWMRAPLVLR